MQAFDYMLQYIATQLVLQSTIISPQEYSQQRPGFSLACGKVGFEYVQLAVVVQL